jgi:ribonuclease HIII
MKKSCFTATIDQSKITKLKNDLEDQGFTFTQPAYTVFCAKKEKVVCAVYKSGKMVIQGKGMDEFIEFYIEPELLQNLSYTNPHADTDKTAKIGVDEAGKGDFFGPLCIAGVYADEDAINKLIKLNIQDSKKIKDSTIIKLAKEIRSICEISVIRLFPIKYNELYKKFNNLNTMLGWAHSTVIANLSEKTNCKNALIDQFANKSVVENALKKKNLKLNLVQRTHAESDIVVAAASIIARASFVEGIDLLSDDVSIKLPKGAGAPVLAAGKKIFLKEGLEIFSKIAKLHFKTLKDIQKD